MSPSQLAVPEEDVQRIRRFNRFYTQRIGLLGQLDESDLSVTAARLLIEIEQLEEPSSAEAARALDLDPGYVSRVVKSLEGRGLLRKTPCPEDGRRRRLSLTEDGRHLHQRLSERADRDVARLLEPLDADARTRLLAALDTVESLLGDPVPASVAVREHGPGDIGWVLQRHGELYREAYGFDHVFEALVGQILVSFSLHQEPRRERLWIAEDRGRRLGSVMLVAEGEDRATSRTARLRLFLVEPDARGLGLGTRLLDTLLDFARRRDYDRIVLSTVDALTAARHLYERAGFQLVRQFDHRDWSVPVTEEEWLLELSTGPNWS